MARPKSDETKRFLDKVRVMESGCHEWQAGKGRGGYGKFQNNGKTIQAHRFAYSHFVGDIGEHHVLHKCDNRKCVNTDHLFLGSILENIQDMDKKGRRGTTCYVTKEQAEEVRKMLDDRYSQQYIADKFSMSQTIVSKIKRNKIRLFKSTERK